MDLYKKMNPRRVLEIHPGNEGSGPVVYWMSRDQRVSDNWALCFAQQQAFERKRSLVVAFCLVEGFLGATKRHYGFMLKGLEEVHQDLESMGITWLWLVGDPEKEIFRTLVDLDAALLVTDFDPLKIKRAWKSAVCRCVSAPVYEVDAHNIVPCRIASDKQEYGAYTLRPKIHRLLDEFLEPFPRLDRHPFTLEGIQPSVSTKEIVKRLKLDESVPEVEHLKPGEKAAHAAMHQFLKQRLEKYPEKRNDPNAIGQSGLSPYLHFGQLSAQRLAWEVSRSKVGDDAKAEFLEELIVRRELADNFCLYNDSYDSTEGFPSWAKTTLKQHTNDPRDYLYARETFERSETHDELWNAAQRQMMNTGAMHGYMRMYWCKKILEWSATPEDAMQTAIYLNDRYSLDGRDPNGYAGIAWSIGGVHDRAWKERDVYGKIRYMNRNGCQRKFYVATYIKSYLVEK